MKPEQLTIDLEIQRGLLRVNGKREDAARDALEVEIRRIGESPDADLDKLIELVEQYKAAKSDARANLLEITRIKREMQKGGKA